MLADFMSPLETVTQSVATAALAVGMACALFGASANAAIPSHDAAYLGYSTHPVWPASRRNDSTNAYSTESTTGQLRYVTPEIQTLGGSPTGQLMSDPGNIDPVFAPIMPVQYESPAQNQTGTQYESDGLGDSASLPTFDSAPANVLAPSRVPTYRANLAEPRLILLPGQVLFRPFIAGDHAPRLAAEYVGNRQLGPLLDFSLGAQIALLRYGTVGPHASGWELGTYGLAFGRMAQDREMDVEATDYRFGVPITYRNGGTAFRFGYDHLSSHVGDEFLGKNPGFNRLNYVRDQFQVAVIQDLEYDLQVYAEGAYAFHVDGGARPLEYQVGLQYQPYVPTGFRGAPVAAVNLHGRQEFHFTPAVKTIIGWQWRGAARNDLIRFGFTYYNGHSIEYSFLRNHESLAGAGLWYDF